MRLANAKLQLFLPSGLFWRRQTQFGSGVLLLAPRDALLRQLIEVREELIELALRQRVKLVIVALSTSSRQSHPHGRGRADAVGDVLGAVLFGSDTGLLGNHVIAVEPGRDPLFDRRIWQQVAGELFDRELIERHVRVEGVDDPIAPTPHEPLVVREIAVCVGVPRLIEPVACLMFAVARRREQSVDDSLERIRFRVREEFIDLVQRRRQASQIECDSPQQRDAICWRRRPQPSRCDASEHKPVDRSLCFPSEI